jgi:PIF1-like helicase
MVIYSDKVYTLFNWTGKPREYKHVTIRPKRLPQDAYTNSYSKLISSSMAPCNSNISITVGSKATIYASCYSAKATQKEDTGEFKRMASYVANRFQEQRREQALFEGLSRLMGAVLAGTSQHVCAAPMAAYLVRNQSRFKFSHEFKYIPVRELINLLCDPSKRNTMELDILPHIEGCFFSNDALHYLHRPTTSEFEHLSLLEFFKKYEVVRSSTITEKDKETFDIDDPSHPGFQKQVIRKIHKSRSVLPQFCHWSLPDTACFQGDILTMDEYPMKNGVENYCRTILILFHHFRTLDDLMNDGSYHKRLLELYPKGKLPTEACKILNNAQMYYDSLRLPARDDPITCCTTPFQGPQQEWCEDDDSDNDNEDDFTDLFGLLTAGQPILNHADNQSSSIIALSLLSLRKQGGKGCGFMNLPSLFTSVPALSHFNTESTNIQVKPLSFISNAQLGNNIIPPSVTIESHLSHHRDKVKVSTLMHLTYDCTKRRLLSSNSIDSPPHVPVEASGTAVSILEWSKQTSINLDKEQQLAFQIATAAFVLSYYEDADVIEPCLIPKPNGGSSRGQLRHDFNSEKEKLQQLARLKQNEPLHMFLDGGGGSGKSHVVNQILKYAQDYTTRLGLTFNMRTVIVTAMSGVAATCIGGETLHSAACFYRNAQKEAQHWDNARLLIIDEISFMSTTEASLLDVKLRELLRCPNSLFWWA